MILGEGELRDHLEHLVRERHLEKHVLLPGFRTDVLGCLKGVDLFVMSSVTEGLGTSLLDAMACEKAIVATTAASDAGWRKAIAETGAHVIECEAGADGGVNLHQLLRSLGQRSVTSVWAEGGGTLLGSLFDEGLVDEVWAFIAPLVIGGEGRPAVAGKGARLVAEAWRLREVATERLGDDMLIRGYAGEWSPAVD